MAAKKLDLRIPRVDRGRMGEGVSGPLLLPRGVLTEVDAFGDQVPLLHAHKHAAVYAAAAADLDRGAVDDLRRRLGAAQAVQRLANLAHHSELLRQKVLLD